MLSSQSYDSGIGLGPGMESHGGSMYTGLAALALMGARVTLASFARRIAVDTPYSCTEYGLFTLCGSLLPGTLSELPRRDELVGWCIHRQRGGYQVC